MTPDLNNRTNLSGLTKRVEALEAIGRYDEAIPLIHQGLLDSPENASLLSHLSFCHLKLERCSSALEYANKAIAANPAFEWPHRLRGHALNGLGRKAEALESMREAARLAPRWPETIKSLCEIELSNGLIGDALRTAELLTKIAPEWPETFDMLALIALRQKRFDDAQTYCREALKLNPNSYASLNNMGVALLRQGQARQSIDFFFEAAKHNPSKELPQKNLMGAVGTLYISPRTTYLILVFILLPALVSIGVGLVEAEPKLWIGGMAIVLLTITVILLVRRSYLRKLPSPVQLLLKTRAGRKAEAKAAWRMVAAAGATFGILILAALIAIPFAGFGIAPVLAILAIRVIVAARKQGD